MTNWSEPYDPLTEESAGVWIILGEMLTGEFPFSSVLHKAGVFEITCEVFSSGQNFGELKLRFSTISLALDKMPRTIQAFSCQTDAPAPQEVELYLRALAGCDSCPQPVALHYSQEEIARAKLLYDQLVKKAGLYQSSRLNPTETGR